MTTSGELAVHAIDWKATERLFFPDKERFFSLGNRKEKMSPRTKEILKMLAAGVIVGLSFVVPTGVDIAYISMTGFFNKLHPEAATWAKQELDKHPVR